jgi:hypothetical protein
MSHDAQARLLLFQFETIAPVPHTLVRTALLYVSHPLSITITTAIALPTIFLVLCRLLQLMAQSTFDERLARLMNGESRCVVINDSTHLTVTSILLKHFAVRCLMDSKALLARVGCLSRVM